MEIDGPRGNYRGDDMYVMRREIYGEAQEKP